MDMERTPNSVPDFRWEQPQPKPPFALAKSDTAFALCAVAGSIFTAVFGIFGGFSLGYLLSVILMTLLMAAYFIKCGKVRIWAVLCGVLALANSAVFVCTTNGSVRFFGVVVSFLLQLTCFDGLVNPPVKGNRQSLNVFYGAASTMGNAGVAVKSLLSDANGGSKTVAKTLIGLLCAVPVLFVVVPLLIASDAAFSGMMENLFGNAWETLLKAVFGVGMSVFVIAYGFSLKTGRTARAKQGSFVGVENVYIISFLSAFAVCYLLYLFSQLAYFFSAFRGFLPEGEMTYAQYARKGFFEMCIIAVINLVMVFAALLLAKKQDGRVCRGIQILSTFIAVFTLIIIATAISKMVLYIGAYGMTCLRLTTSAFMVFLAVVFGSVILRIYSTKINVVKTALLTAGCVVLILGTVNVNRVCAQYNYESYINGKLDTVDVTTLYHLGDEGVPYLVKLAEGENTDLAQQAKNYLAKAYLWDYFNNMAHKKEFTAEDLQKNQKHKGFSYFSIPKAAAYESLYEFIQNHPEFSKVCQNYYFTYMD